MTDDTPDENDNTTTSTMERWTYTASAAALALHLSLVVLLIGHSVGAFSLSTVPQGWLALYSVAEFTALAWTFGEGKLQGALERVKTA